MTGEEFNTKVRELLPESLLSQVGTVLHSPVATVRPGEVYVLGANPGRPKTPRTIDQYLDWRLTEPDRHSLLDAHGSPFHHRTAELLESLGYKVRDVCFSNLSFVATPSVASLEASIARQCWPVHQFILDQVRPRWILSLGSSNKTAYRYLADMHAGTLRPGPTCPTGHGDYCAKSLVGTIDSRPMAVVGIPHPGRFVIKNVDGMRDWVHAVAKAAA